MAALFAANIDWFVPGPPGLPWTGLSPTALDAVRDRQVVVFWALADRLARLGLGRQTWHDAGVVGVTDPPAGRGG